MLGHVQTARYMRYQIKLWYFWVWRWSGMSDVASSAMGQSWWSLFWRGTGDVWHSVMFHVDKRSAMKDFWESQSLRCEWSCMMHIPRYSEAGPRSTMLRTRWAYIYRTGGGGVQMSRRLCIAELAVSLVAWWWSYRAGTGITRWSAGHVADSRVAHRHSCQWT